MEALRNGKVTNLPSNAHLSFHAEEHEDPGTSLACTMAIGVANGVFDIQGTSLNDIFPDIKPTGMKEFMEKCWAGKASLAE